MEILREKKIQINRNVRRKSMRGKEKEMDLKEKINTSCLNGQMCLCIWNELSQRKIMMHCSDHIKSTLIAKYAKFQKENATLFFIHNVRFLEVQFATAFANATLLADPRNKDMFEKFHSVHISI